MFELGISHGVEPRDAAYAYVTVMNTDKAAMQEYVKNPAVQVLRNDERVQAVYHSGLKMLQAIVYKADTIETPTGLSVDINHPCAVLVQENGDALSITVSDPTHRPRCIDVTVNRELPVLEGADPTAENVTCENGASVVTFCLNDGAYAGSSTTYSSKTGFSARLK